MEVRNCKQCGRLYNYVGGTYKNLCPACADKIEAKFVSAKTYIEENPGASINEVSEAVEINVKQIEKWVREERLFFADDSPIGIPCEKCGKTIKTGRYCHDCATALEDTFKEMYRTDTTVKKTPRDNKMRFIDK